jgi:ATP-dependent DNA helicase RecQ
MSDSLENYAQEAGRGARDQNLEAFCPILYDEEDLDKHFDSLNRTKITASEINSIFRVLKRTKGDVINKTAFEIAAEAGWDVEDESNDYSTKIKTALLELEREGYISRKRNKTRYFADSVAVGSMQKLHEILDTSEYSDEEKQRFVLVMQTILGRGKSDVVQVDELAYLLGYPKDSIAYTIQKLKEMELLGDSKDLSLKIGKNAIASFKAIEVIEQKLFAYLHSLHSSQVTIKELSEYLYQEEIIKKNESTLIRDLLRNWRDKTTFIFSRISRQSDLWYFEFYNADELQKKIQNTHAIAKKLLNIFTVQIDGNQKDQVIDFSLLTLRNEIGEAFSLKEIDKTLLYLHHLHLVELLNGRFISYSPMQITKTQKVLNKRKYTNDEYEIRLAKHYITKTESIHIMGEYAKRLQSDDYHAGMFLKDYFILSYNDFKKKYNLLKEKLTRPISQHRYEKIFAKMSLTQKEIMEDTSSKAMMILAGPGSGKTRVLVHKIASLILTEDVKPEQFMMLTFSRTAAGEFRSRLNQLIGTLSYDIEISTFHAYALKLIGRVVKDNDDLLQQSIVEATRQIRSGDIVLPYKGVLVLDEFQDINAQSFELVKAIYYANEKEMRIIAVGDDDQCINVHAGADVRFIEQFEKEFGDDDEGNHLYKQYELLTNFRSTQSIVNYTNDFIERVKRRYKQHPLEAFSKEISSVRVHTCRSQNLITPAFELVKSYKEQKDIAILAYTNDEVMQIYSLLQEAGIGARFIIDREKFSLSSVIEIVEFDKTINAMLGYDTFYTEEMFERALTLIKSKFEGSKNLNLLEKVIDRFLFENQDRYVSGWLAYLDEIKLEEFEEYGKSITVSTIHKSKGMEFEKVIVLVNKTPVTDEEKRLYYVGMTRAKSELSILRHGNESFDKKANAEYIYDANEYPKEQRLITLVMGLGDIHLGYTGYHHYHDFTLIAGSEVTFEMREKQNTFCIIVKNKSIGCLSKAFHQQMTKYLTEGYRVQNAMIDFVVVWKSKDRMSTQPLCKIVLKK